MSPRPRQSSNPFDLHYSDTVSRAPQQQASDAVGGSFFNDPLSAHFGFNVAERALEGGGELAEKNVSKYLFALKPYFAVTNIYVLHKLRILLFPWASWGRHTTSPNRSNNAWKRASAIHGVKTVYLSPREDVNAPDMYIPVMSFVSYILLSALIFGLTGTFHPELLGYTASKALTVIAVEVAGLKLACYFLGIVNSQVLDFVAYSGYKFVGVMASMAFIALLGKEWWWTTWAVFVYLWQANAFFLLRSLGSLVLPKEDTGRLLFLFCYSYLVQFLLMFVLAT